MKFIITTIFMIAVFSTFGCNSQQNSYKKISLAIGGCNKVKNCPFITMEIDSNLIYKQYCFQNCDSTGFFSGNISKSTEDEINVILNKIKLNNIELEYEPYRDDEYIKIKIHEREISFYVVGHYNELPEEIKDIIKIVKNIPKSIELKRETDNNKLEFEIPIPMDNYYLLPIPSSSE